MSRIIPLGERILVEAIQAETETTSGIVLPDSKEKPNEGKIIAVGGNVKDLVIGDIVLYKKYSPTEIKHEGKDYLILDAEDVLAKIK